MLELFWMEDSMKGVCTLEFIGPRHINADIRLISRESGPDLSSTFAEGDGRTLVCSHQEIGSAKQTAYHLNGECCSVGKLPMFSESTFPRYKALPQGSDETMLGFFSFRPLSRGD